MKLKLASSALVGLLVGLLVGGYATFSVMHPFFLESVRAQMWGPRIDTHLGESYLALKLIENGEVDAAKSTLIRNVQLDTLAAAQFIEVTSKAGLPLSGPERALLRYVESAGELASVRNDDSEFGREAAKARARVAADYPGK